MTNRGLKVVDVGSIPSSVPKLDEDKIPSSGAGLVLTPMARTEA